MPVLGNEDHKQRVNLSSFARSVIEIDLSVFNEGGSFSGFLNRIITSFRDLAEASVDLAAEDRQRQLLMCGYDPEVVKRLVQDYRTQLTEKNSQYPAGDSVVFRLNNQNFSLLYEECAESTAYSAPSKYLKALLEEYTRLPTSQRERVYYGPLIRQGLEPALETGRLLEVRMGGKVFAVKPYSLMSDPFNSHLYLVGIAYQTDKTAQKQSIASFRVSRLEGVKVKKQSGKLSPEEKRQIEKQLQQVGVQYLVGNSDHIQVRLTPAGRQAFLQRSYMRPVPEEIRGDVYYFNCTAMQIRNYFLSFGKDAEVLEPASLRKLFGKIYRDAAKVYDESLG